MNNKDPNKNHIPLNDIPKKNIHQVPDGYFEKLPQQIQQRVVGHKSNAIWNWSWSPSRIFAGTLSAISIIALVLYFSIFKNDESINNKNVVTLKLPSSLSAEVIDSGKTENNNYRKTNEHVNPKPIKDQLDNDIKVIAHQDTNNIEVPEVKKQNAEILIAQLDKSTIAAYLETENTEEYEWEEVNARL